MKKNTYVSVHDMFLVAVFVPSNSSDSLVRKFQLENTTVEQILLGGVGRSSYDTESKA